MEKFIIPPDSSSYSVATGSEVVSILLDGGMARYRKDLLGASSKVSVSWIFNQDEYKYFKSFFNGIVNKGSLPFLIDLIVDDSVPTEHKCYFVPGTIQLTAQKGYTFWVSCQLEATPVEDNDGGDFAILYGQLGASYFVSESLFNDIVNVKLAGDKYNG